VDENSDIDLMVVFQNPCGHKPQSFLNNLKTFAEKWYYQSVVRQSNPSIVLELNHIKFELVPAFIQSGYYYIPQNSSEWQYTDPIRFNSAMQESNKNNGYIVKPVIRLMKYWNIQKNERNMVSFVLEQKIAEDISFAYYSCTSCTDYLIKSFNIIKYSTNVEKVNVAINNINRALNYENDNMLANAKGEITKAFPEV
jgi:hypothetical protein